MHLPSFLKENSSFLAKLQWGQISYTQYFGSSNHNHNKNMSDQWSSLRVKWRNFYDMYFISLRVNLFLLTLYNSLESYVRYEFRVKRSVFMQKMYIYMKSTKYLNFYIALCIKDHIIFISYRYRYSTHNNISVIAICLLVWAKTFVTQ